MRFVVIVIIIIIIVVVVVVVVIMDNKNNKVGFQSKKDQRLFDFFLPWPWRWSDDLDVRPALRSSKSEDASGEKKAKAFTNQSQNRTQRHTDTQTRPNAQPRRIGK